MCSEHSPVHGHGAQTLLEKKNHEQGLADLRWDPDAAPAFGQALDSGEGWASPLVGREPAGQEAGQPSNREGAGAGHAAHRLPHMA